MTTMGTNYYARIIPTRKRKQELHDAIEADDFFLVKKLTKEMYGRIERDWDTGKVIGGAVHLGKCSMGWKFLWDTNIFVVISGRMEDVNGTRQYVRKPSKALYTYPLTKQGLRDFIFRDDVRIYDECDEQQEKEAFWTMALAWGSDMENGGWDDASYERWSREHNGNYRIYPVTGELTDLLKSEGYKFTSSSCSDFYSDGLRFAGFTDFS